MTSSAHFGKAARVTQFQEIEDSVAGQAPIVCNRCLGPNNMLRMTKEVAGKKCAVCSKPFTVFSWKIATDARQKSTVICRSCAESRKKCQACLGMMTNSSSDSNNNNNNNIRQRDDDEQGEDHKQLQGKSSVPSNSAANNTHSHRAKICSFFLKGQCTRGNACPFSHVLPTSSDSKQQTSSNTNNIKDRFFGNDHITQQQLAMMMGGTDVNQTQQQQQQLASAPTAAAAATATTKPVETTKPTKPASNNNKSGFGFDWMGSIQ